MLLLYNQNDHIDHTSSMCGKGYHGLIGGNRSM